MTDHQGRAFGAEFRQNSAPKCKIPLQNGKFCSGIFGLFFENNQNFRLSFSLGGIQKPRSQKSWSF